MILRSDHPYITPYTRHSKLSPHEMPFISNIRLNPHAKSFISTKSGIEDTTDIKEPDEMIDGDTLSDKSCRTKLTTFWLGNEKFCPTKSFVRRKILSDENFVR